MTFDPRKAAAALLYTDEGRWAPDRWVAQEKAFTAKGADDITAQSARVLALLTVRGALSVPVMARELNLEESVLANCLNDLAWERYVDETVDGHVATADGEHVAVETGKGIAKRNLMAMPDDLELERIVRASS